MFNIRDYGPGTVIDEESLSFYPRGDGFLFENKILRYQLVFFFPPISAIQFQSGIHFPKNLSFIGCDSAPEQMNAYLAGLGLLVEKFT